MTKNDVIDIVRGYSISEPTKLVVSRIEILDISPRPIEKKVAVAIRRQKSLIIDNYPGDDAHVDKKAEEQFNPLSNQWNRIEYIVSVYRIKSAINSNM